MLNTLDLFAGIGGFSLGLERTGGFHTAAFCEIDQAARKVLNKQWPTVPIYEDVTALTKETLDADGITIDAITGGFPCQDISLAGKGAGLAGTRSGLWYQFHRLIDEIRPQVVIAENVAALRSRGLDSVLRSLSEIGYDAEWHCIPAAAVGAPHRRDRIWITAYPSGSVFGRDTPGVLRQPEGGNAFGGRKDLRQQDGQASAIVTTAACETMAHTNNPRLQGFLSAALSGGETTDRYGRPQRLCGPSGKRLPRNWPVEPNVGRVAHGVPKRVDRLKQLGNAVVPQIPELLGAAILASA